MKLHGHVISSTRRHQVPGGNGQVEGHRAGAGDENGQGGLALYAQPIVDLRSGRPVRHELLLGLVEDGGAVTNGDVLAADHLGPVEETDRWVLDRAVEFAAATPVNLNLTAPSITPDYVEYAAELLETAGANPANLAFEVSEPDLLDAEDEGREFLWGLHRLGCWIAVDEVGSVSPELGHLRSLPPGYWKLAHGLVWEVRRHRANREAVEAITELARIFGSRTIAVGVDDLATLQILEGLGADQAQGPAFGHPVPAYRLAASA
jgi:EAL domain-containing protein (putative c-di-GMP-specific phosphodiesterase class I)